ncbi:hypothetical protein Poli38472_002111 [Pythium oligandrum]|uniref:Protein CASP n=1 Tax=Pythium oligandrum TaxID=41045 RepID=A0A8K1CI62_PYTOL|nr:hypothetical protein Poli38472_002111 [Pythium oligandrum]|eukprot:TMW63170.1 hypothetical protein Poli38472_002111 [Pythium oligandrum]
MEQVAGDKVMTEAAASAVGTAVASAPSSRGKNSGLSRNAIGTVLQYWKAFDLDSKRVMLDTQGGTMKTEKDNSLRSRKKLAETTKNFRKLPDADKVASVGGLLRAYQEEIDNLTRRAKYAENSFFTLYKGLYAAPDPVPSLESLNDMNKLGELEEENKKLQNELREYEIEFSSLKNQDITIRKLEEQVALMERNMDDVVHQKASERCKELEDQLTAKTLEFNQQRMDYERQLDQGRSDLREAFSRLDALQSELFEHKQRSGLAQSSFNAEIEAMSQEALMMQTLRLENSQLKKQLADLLSVAGDGSGGRTMLTSLTTTPPSDLSQKEATIVSLRQEVFRLKEAVTHLEDQAASDKSRYDDLLDQAKRARDDLSAQLAARPTMETFNEIQHQLRVLQQLEYNIVDEEGIQTAPGGSSSETDATQASTETEKILVSRVRRLEHTLQQRDLVIQEQSDELKRAQDALAQKEKAIAEQADLLRSLEETVAALESRRGGGDASRTDVGAEILLDAVDDQLTDRKAADGANGAGVAAESKMFEIVRGQRDRFRDRMKELQTEKNKIEELVNTYKSQVARLEHDNMQLYQKIRYVESYRGKGPSNMRVAPGSSMSDLEGGSATSSVTEVESRYKSMYEEKMNPFQQFNKLETQQRYTNLNTVDKILLNSAKLFLGHRITRNIAFGYILLLHFLVFATLYTFMHGCGISNE